MLSSSTVHSASPHQSSSSTTSSPRSRIHASLNTQHFILDPNVLAHEPSSSNKALFDAVPRNADFESLRPILARLPLDSASDDESDEEAKSLDYTRKDGVMYTRSRLPHLDPASRELWKSMHHFRPLRADYAMGYLDLVSPSPPHPLSSTSLSSCPFFSSASEQALVQLRRSFNWSSLPPLSLSLEKVWYGVLFLSVRKAGSESLSFYEADRLAHEEATQSGGLIVYWYGSPDPTSGTNLATCIWTSRTAAIAASKLPLHKKAARYAAPSYERYDLVRYKIVKHAGQTQLKLSQWTQRDDQAEADLGE